ncbi:FkbM family methyltransferase [Sphingomonas adhaesiva]|uniref:FkbM family methyltransferase n=1 Tax=Sphingomonas adhaesiva TaxID=28212 RepID=UPI002FF9BDA3
MGLFDSAIIKVQDTFSAAPLNRRVAVGDTIYTIPLRGELSKEHLASYEEYFERMIGFILRRRAGTFADVGVNVGQILLKVKSMDPSRPYIGFEPSLACVAYVDEVIRINALSDCTIVPLALSDRRGTMTFHYSTGADPQATMIDGFWTAQNARKLEKTIFVERGDDVVRSITADRIAILKVDVEGGELEVLSGFTGILQEDRPIVLVEVLPYLTNYSGPETETMAFRERRCRTLMETFAASGYTPFRILPGMTIEPVDHFGAERFVAEMTNYIILPDEEVETFRASLTQAEPVA